MENKCIHPSLPLTIDGDRVLGPDGVVGYVNCGEEYLYVFFFNDKMVVSERSSFDSIMTRLVNDKIREKYHYAFKIICRGGVTAVVDWISEDVALIGITSGYLKNGVRLWRDASDIPTWPGLRGALNEAGTTS